MRSLLAALVLLAFIPRAEAQAPSCLVPAAFPAIPIVSAAVESGHVLKAAPGCLLGVYVTSTVAGFLMVFNSATVPANGAVTPVECVAVGAGATQYVNYAPFPPAGFTTGISVAMSTTGCFNLTLSPTAFFHAVIQ